MYNFREKQGLYDPIYEHDACGIGAIANIKGIKSHDIINNALDILVHLEHRGGTGAEDNTGDGAGILFQIPHKFFSSLDLDFELPNEFDYGVAQIFLSKNKEFQNEALAVFEEGLKEANIELLGYRKVVYNDFEIGLTAKKAMPYILQAFVKKPSDLTVSKEFEKRLFVARRIIEKKAISKNIQDFYICSFSSKTIVYKGMLLSTQVKNFYIDLMDTKMESAIALVHSRFSTNTFPSWQRAHPNRFICHNGEINTIRGNVNNVRGRESGFENKDSSINLEQVLPVIAYESSDSAMYDNFLEFLYMNDFPIEEAVMITIPEPWTKNEEMDDLKRSFYEYHSTIMEPWDGPASIIFTDGEKLGASLDRNGLRPSRYAITSDDNVIIYSETGAMPLDEEKIIVKGRLEPGKLLLVDTTVGSIIKDEDLKKHYSSKYPYKKWNQNITKISKISNEEKYEFMDNEQLEVLKKLFGYTKDEMSNGIAYLANHGDEKIIAMGVDTPIAPLSKKNKLLYDFFRQNFAQVTNPPIDAVRESIVTSSRVYLGREGNILSKDENNCRRIKLDSPILSSEELQKIKTLDEIGHKVETISLTYDINHHDLENTLNELCYTTYEAVKNGCDVLIFSDRDTSKYKAAIPALLAASCVHNYLNDKNLRTKVSLVFETAEAREIHHFACLIGYGVTAICPYLVYDIINDLVSKKSIVHPYNVAQDNYIKGINKGIIKIISKMGISTIQSYAGAQIFEAIGLDDELVDKYFKNTTNSISGMSLESFEKKLLERHYIAYNNEEYTEEVDDTLMEKSIISLLQESCETGNYSKFKEYSKLVDSKLVNVRDILEFDTSSVISIDEVESAESIVKRFKTGAMSYGSISLEAHECLAMAMNKIGGRANSGEGGESRERFYTLKDNLSSSTAIKQIASGRFGVNMEYLLNAKEIQIKVAQGAKPGEGGQLPAAKVFPWIAESRNSTPGVSLISPPPHHDIYSIEDLAQLIYDMKNANQDAEISVKLVSEAGIGTVASGVVKAGANKVLISGFDGGTGAAPRTSVPNCGMPWEVGLAECHQTLILNNLRDRVKLETDGKLMTGRDVAMAALLGAEEYGFATAPLIVIGCKMLRVCNLNTCPFGVATQKEELRKKFRGNVDYVVNFMYYIAEELREYMAKLGFRTVYEMIGRVDKLKVNKEIATKHHMNLDKLLYKPEVLNKTAVHFKEYKKTDLSRTLDKLAIVPLCKDAILNDKKVVIDLKVDNEDRTLGTILSSEITKHKPLGLPDDTITLNVVGNAGNSLGAFLTKGVTINITGDTNDYLAKGLCGGKISVKLNPLSNLEASKNIIAGNVILYGATKGELYLDGIAGERFAVRNSGANAIALGCGQHGCEYMTGGKVIILGNIGINFASGMSGGIAYVYGKHNIKNINKSLVECYDIDQTDITFIKDMMNNHINYTNSEVVKDYLNNFDPSQVIKVIPRDYLKVINLIEKYKNLNDPDPMYKAFLESLNK